MYVDAFHDRKADIIRIAERVNGKRILIEHKPDYTFYVEDPRGKQRSIYGDPVACMKANSKSEFRKLIAQHSHCKKFESDIKPLNKVLEKHYLNAETPKLHNAFFDIEVDFDPERGYATPEEAFMPITSIGVYLQWMETMVCFAVPPKTLSWEQAESIAKRVGNVVLCRTEKEMLEHFLQVIDDADILSGWNSEGYDIPYTVNRIIKVMGRQETRRLCLWDQLPHLKEYEKFGKEQKSYTLTGRVHMDYLELYRKYNYEERHSYKLDYIGEMEVGEKKVEYEGSLDRLYNHDFEKFLEYNIQDTLLLDKLDRKLQFIDLANTIAHDNTVLLPTIMGAVATTEQGIINEAHRRGFVCPDKVHSEKDSKAAGAYVAQPVKGHHEWIGSSDLNSLYPSVFRALNMGAETIVGQIRLDYTERELEQKQAGTWIDPEIGDMIPKKLSFSDSWSGKFASNEYELMMKKDSSVPLKLDMEDGTTLDVTGSDMYNLIFHSGEPWNISANGTIFKTDFQGIVPGLLERWYAERKQMQAKKKEFKEGTAEYNFWDKRQLVKKINLNSLYGAILNPHCRFFDKRIGQSTTLTGRSIARHMAAKTNELLAGVYDHSGETIIYGDTDSVYFSAVPVLPEGSELDLESAVKLYDHVSDTVSDTFPGFLKEAFNVPLEAGQVMKAGREVVGRAGLFITKKRYAIKCLDIEGWQPEGGKLKIMGMDVKRSDTPEFVQDFLEDILDDALSGYSEEDVIAKIREFKEYFQGLEPWKKGMPKRVNNLTPYTRKYEKIKGISGNNPLDSTKSRDRDVKQNNMIPGHVSASIHWNYLKKMHGDQYSMNITDGMKVIVCKLKDNPLGYTNVAYPTDEIHLPDWFKELPFDEEGMEQSVLNKKIENVLGAMSWDLSRANQSAAMEEFFEF